MSEASAEAERAVARVRDAVDRRSPGDARLDLHPYLHWRFPTGTTMRGRVKVLAMLAERASLDAPASVELRDGQIYRWTE